MTLAIKGISSMATRQLLAQLGRDYERVAGCVVGIESVGGVDAARRVAAGEAFDFVVLAADALEKLVAAERVVPGSRRDIARSGVAVAVRSGAPVPEISSEGAVRSAVLAARSLSYSTGPSGVALARLFERWGIAEAIAGRIVQAPPGVPVGSLVARGEVELGFQQLSELLHLDGITVVGPLPPAIQVITTFSAGLCKSAMSPDAARGLIDFMASSAGDGARAREGMEGPA